ncbi:MAG: DUF3106 domain-containing protein [Planctomycetes bacterium]|nr:DUF3106 domain-containing protein [Planctomycetota bacterium]
MKISSALLILCFALAAPFVAAAQGDAAPGTASRPSVEQLKRNIEHWKSLPQSERDRIKQSYRQYRAFKPEQVAAVRDNFQKFQNLPAERRRELSKKLEGLPPQQRERIAQKLRELQEMGADRRKMAVAFVRMAQGLTPEQKRQLKQLSTPEEKKEFLGREFRGHVVREYLQDKSSADRAAFEALSRPEQKRKLQQFFRERVSRGPPGERGGQK